MRRSVASSRTSRALPGAPTRSLASLGEPLTFLDGQSEAYVVSVVRRWRVRRRSGSRTSITCPRRQTSTTTASDDVDLT
jgi:hypothetical protein